LSRLLFIFFFLCLLCEVERPSASQFRRSIPARADGRSHQEPTVDPNNWYQSLEIRPVIMALVPQGAGGSSVTMAYPVLVPAKYTCWAIKVQAILDAQGL
jgi:hypothetical protein